MGLESAENIAIERETQYNKLFKTTDIEVGLLLNFGKEPQLKSKVFSSEFKS